MGRRKIDVSIVLVVPNAQEELEFLVWVFLGEPIATPSQDELRVGDMTILVRQAHVDFDGSITEHPTRCIFRIGWAPESDGDFDAVVGRAISRGAVANERQRDVCIIDPAGNHWFLEPR
jgi:hypothetical protein